MGNMTVKPVACKDCKFHIPFRNILLDSTNDRYDRCSFVRSVTKEVSLRDGVEYIVDEPTYLRYARVHNKCGIEGRYFQPKEPTKLQTLIKRIKQWLLKHNKSLS